MSWDVATATDDQLIDLCHKAEKEGGRIGNLMTGNRVVKISEHLAVKYGYGVTAAEAATQQFAHSRADPNTVHVPRVYRYAQREFSPERMKGYLFMEYISGQTLEHVDLETHQDLLPRVAKIVAHLGQIKGDQNPPGPLGGGIPDGILWGMYGAPAAFNSVEELNTYMNKRLIIRGDSIDLTPYPLVLCHMDLCRRNMILKDDGVSIALVDWAFSGLYPRFFETATFSFQTPYDEPYEKPVLQEIEKLLCLTDEEKRLSKLVQAVRGANWRWTFDEVPAYTFDVEKFMAEYKAKKAKAAKEKGAEEKTRVSRIKRFSNRAEEAAQQF